MVSFLNNLPRDDGGVLVSIFHVTLVVQGIAILISLGYAVAFLMMDRKRNAYVRTAEGINDYVRQVQRFNASVRPVERIDLRMEIQSFLIEQYGGAASFNFKFNKDRQAIFSSAMASIIVAAGLALLSAIPYFGIKLHVSGTSRAITSPQAGEGIVMAEKKIEDIEQSMDDGGVDSFAPEPVGPMNCRPRRPGLLLLRDWDSSRQSEARGDVRTW